MDAIAYLTSEIRWAHELLNMVTADITEEQIYWIPPGIANPLGAIYAHAVCEADAIVNGLLKGGEPLFSSSWKDRTGVSEPRMNLQLDEARSLKLNLDDFRRYAQAVFTAIESYASSLDESDLDREVDLTRTGLGKKNVAWVLSALVAGHLNNMSGEISCLKGIQGAKGYPF